MKTPLPQTTRLEKQVSDLQTQINRMRRALTGLGVIECCGCGGLMPYVEDGRPCGPTHLMLGTVPVCRECLHEDEDIFDHPLIDSYLRSFMSDFEIARALQPFAQVFAARFDVFGFDLYPARIKSTARVIWAEEQARADLGKPRFLCDGILGREPVPELFMVLDVLHSMKRGEAVIDKIAAFGGRERCIRFAMDNEVGWDSRAGYYMTQIERYALADALREIEAQDREGGAE